MNLSPTVPRIGMISLGCPKALVDSERILTRLKAEGYALVPDYQQADLVIINTCGFIDSAVEESLQTIGEALDQNGRVIVTGCLGERAEIIEQRYPNVLAITGAHAYEPLVRAVHEHLPPPSAPYDSLLPAQGIKLTPRHYAYLKIAEGCNHRCRFCIIPQLRGDQVSTPLDRVMRDAERLVKAGVKELLIISQDSSAYGVDIGYQEVTWQGQTWRSNLYDLCRALGTLGVWVRWHYVYPYPHVDKIIPLMADGQILPYLDIPFQHASPRILKLMKRPAGQAKVLERLKIWRKICPDIVIRSTFIVGFPGETEEDFQQLLDFLTIAQLDRVGCFRYSPVEGAPANELPDHVSEEVKEQRWHRLMQHQQAISQQKLAQRVGRTLTVLVDEVNDQQVLARSVADAPEIDGQVILPADSAVQTGDWLTVNIIASDEYDLYGEYSE